MDKLIRNRVTILINLANLVVNTATVGVMKRRVEEPQDGGDGERLDWRIVGGGRLGNSPEKSQV